MGDTLASLIIKRWRIVLCSVLALLMVWAGLNGYAAFVHAEAPIYPELLYQPARDHLEHPLANRSNRLAQPYEPYCDTPRNQDDADLCAQWAAVQAVEESNRLNRLGLLLNFGESAALVVSLVFTAWAALAAAKAAREAERATEGSEKALAIAERNAEAATRQVEITQDTANRQLRPYIDFLNVEIIVDSERSTPDITVAGFQVCFKNFGATPAYKLKRETIITPTWDGEPLWTVEELEAEWGTLPPTGEWFSGAFFQLHPSQWAHVLSGQVVYTISSMITYVDSTGSHFETKMVHKTRPNSRISVVSRDAT